MWLKPDKYRVLIIAVVGTMVAAFGCSHDRADNQTAEVYRRSTATKMEEPEEVKVEILLKDQRQELSRLESEAVPVSASVDQAPGPIEPLTDIINGDYGYDDYGYGGHGGYGYGGYDDYGYGDYGYGGYGGYGYLDVPGPFGGPFGGPFFGPGYPFYVGDFLIVDDDNRRRDDDHHRPDDDNNNDDDGCCTPPPPPVP